LLAILLGLILVNLIQPGKVADLPPDLSFSPDHLHKPDSPLDVLIRMFPVNPFAAAVEGDILGLIFFSILIGFGITQVSDRIRGKILPHIEAAFEVVMQVVHVIIRLVPIGVFGLIVRMCRGAVHCPGDGNSPRSGTAVSGGVDRVAGFHRSRRSAVLRAGDDFYCVGSRGDSGGNGGRDRWDDAGGGPAAGYVPGTG
jgi:hypothetical protein